MQAKSEKTKQLVAIKHMEVETEYQYPLVKVIRELQIMEFLNDTNPKKQSKRGAFACLLDVFSPTEEMERKRVRNLFLVMPLSEKTLYDMVREQQIELQSAKVIMYNLLCALHFLHSSNIVHRDLKPSNVLVDSHGRVMVCDFGLSRTLPESMMGKHNG